MRKSIIAAVAVVAAIALTPLLAASWEVAHADPNTDCPEPPPDVVPPV